MNLSLIRKKGNVDFFQGPDELGSLRLAQLCEEFVRASWEWKRCLNSGGKNNLLTPKH